MRAFTSAAIAALILGGCSGIGDDELDATPSSAIEAAVTTINGILDESSDEGFASLRPHWTGVVANFVGDHLGIPLAWGEACSGRASAQSCLSAVSGGTRTRTYDNCSLANTQFTMQGTVTLTYQDANCALADGNTVTRTLDLRRTGPFGGFTKTTSEAHTAYEGTSIAGGGAQLKKFLTGYEVSLLGVHKIRLNSKGDTLYDVSINTQTPFNATGLVRASRELTGGRAYLYHNSSRYKIELYVSETLRYESGCCYPKEGKLAYSTVGSLQEEGVVSFTSCGKGSIKVGSTETTFTYASCE